MLNGLIPLKRYYFISLNEASVRHNMLFKVYKPRENKKKTIFVSERKHYLPVSIND